MNQLQSQSSTLRSLLTLQLKRTVSSVSCYKRFQIKTTEEHFNQAKSSVMIFTQFFSCFLELKAGVRLLMMCCRFDLLANGGASLTLSFERAPFLTQYRTVWVPWNVFYVMDTLVMKKVSCATAVSLDICLPRVLMD